MLPRRKFSVLAPFCVSLSVERVLSKSVRPLTVCALVAPLLPCHSSVPPPMVSAEAEDRMFEATAALAKSKRIAPVPILRKPPVPVIVPA